MTDILESPELAAERGKMKKRRRRVIYNNDGCDVFFTRLSSPDEFLSQRIVPALDTQVDSVFYCTQVTTLYSHDTEVAERWDGLVDANHSTNEHAMNGRNNMRMLRAAGKDCLELVVETCRQAGLEVFWSHRVNDIHDSMPSCDHLLSQWKRDHPEYLMGSPEDAHTYPMSHPRYWWSAMDFEKPAVPDYLCRITEEICRRYDVDGIEMDYFRMPMFFRPNLTNEDASADQVEILTAFQRRIRQMAYEQGTRRGRPILVAARVPITRERCQHVGIDIETWLDEDLLDVLNTEAGYVPFTMPTRELVKLGHAHGVPVYPTISASGMEPPHNTDAHWRGVAANIWHAGADGVYLFNTFPGTPGHPHFTQLGDPKKLARMSKVFLIDNVLVTDGDIKQGIIQPYIPIELDSSGNPCEVILPVGDDVAGAARARRIENASLRIRFTGRGAEAVVSVRLNGAPIEPAQDDGEWVSYRVDPSRYRHGDNTLEFRVTSCCAATPKPIAVASVELRVDYQ